jgi:hypothetical protein
MFNINGPTAPVLNKLSKEPWQFMGEWRYSSTILEFSISWRRVVIFTSLQVQYPFDGILGGPESR